MTTTIQFLRNAKDARDNGYHLLCAECGTGIFDGTETHERGCETAGEVAAEVRSSETSEDSEAEEEAR